MREKTYMRTIYTIDGVRVTMKIWIHRQIFGEHSSAVFDFFEIRRDK